MQSVPILTDQTALSRNRMRARKRADASSALFLHRSAIADLQERLSEVNRTFTNAAIVVAQPEFWQDAFPQAHVVADDETLKLDRRPYDLIVHAMSLHWANDPLGQLVQCRLALAPDGLFLGVLPGGRTLHELRSSLAEAEARVTGGLSPRVLPMAEIRDLGALLQRAGFALPVADGSVHLATYPDMKALSADLRAMGETNALASRLRRPTRRTVFMAAQDIYMANFGRSDGRLPATFELICLTGWAPHDSQQKPLRPGSARQRLAEALGTPEHPLPGNTAKS